MRGGGVLDLPKEGGSARVRYVNPLVRLHPPSGAEKWLVPLSERGVPYFWS